MLRPLRRVAGSLHAESRVSDGPTRPCRVAVATNSSIELCNDYCLSATASASLTFKSVLCPAVQQDERIVHKLQPARLLSRRQRSCSHRVDTMSSRSASVDLAGSRVSDWVALHGRRSIGVQVGEGHKDKILRTLESSARSESAGQESQIPRQAAERAVRSRPLMYSVILEAEQRFSLDTIPEQRKPRRPEQSLASCKEYSFDTILLTQKRGQEVPGSEGDLGADTAAPPRPQKALAASGAGKPSMITSASTGALLQLHSAARHYSHERGRWRAPHDSHRTCADAPLHSCTSSSIAMQEPWPRANSTATTPSCFCPVRLRTTSSRTLPLPVLLAVPRSSAAPPTATTSHTPLTTSKTTRSPLPTTRTASALCSRRRAAGRARDPARALATSMQITTLRSATRPSRERRSAPAPAPARPSVRVRRATRSCLCRHVAAAQPRLRALTCKSGKAPAHSLVVVSAPSTVHRRTSGTRQLRCGQASGRSTPTAFSQRPEADQPPRRSLPLPLQRPPHQLRGHRSPVKHGAHQTLLHRERARHCHAPRRNPPQRSPWHRARRRSAACPR